MGPQHCGVPGSQRGALATTSSGMMSMSDPHSGARVLGSVPPCIRHDSILSRSYKATCGALPCTLLRTTAAKPEMMCPPWMMGSSVKISSSLESSASSRRPATATTVSSDAPAGNDAPRRPRQPLGSTSCAWQARPASSNCLSHTSLMHADVPNDCSRKVWIHLAVSASTTAELVSVGMHMETMCCAEPARRAKWAKTASASAPLQGSCW
mmetsp:Transcript_46336/g.106999  ORF Transcript_46336/g.106999 Transcript_46336/m.106999 type:complete len:210 (+) Transcript_46336:26-655(+)